MTAELVTLPRQTASLTVETSRLRSSHLTRWPLPFLPRNEGVHAPKRFTPLNQSLLSRNSRDNSPVHSFGKLRRVLVLHSRMNTRRNIPAEQ
jgi:hypothetical protein